MFGAMLVRRKVIERFDALNRHDLETFLQGWTEDASFTFPGTLSVSGIHAGRDAVEAWYRQFLDRFPAIQFTIRHVTVERLLDMSGTNTAMAQWDVELMSRDGRDFHNSGATLITLAGGQITSVREFVHDTGDSFRESWGEAPVAASAHK